MVVEVLIPTKADLGEAALWDAKRQLLWYVDIHQGILYDATLAGKVRSHPMGKMIGTVALTNAKELLIALEDGIYLYHPVTNHLRFIAQPIPRDLAPDMRFNDGKCDPQGRFWVGSLVRNNKDICGTLYRMDEDQTVTPIVHSIQCSNGMGWNAQQDTMYHIDTGTHTVAAYEYNPQNGDIQNKRTVVKVAKSDGWPDGMTVDAEGMLWVAMWGGWKVVRYNPLTGEKLSQIDLPVKSPTSITFAGALLDTMIITSFGDTREDPAQPLAGCVFMCKPGVRGVLSNVWNTSVVKTTKR